MNKADEDFKNNSTLGWVPSLICNSVRTGGAVSKEILGGVGTSVGGHNDDPFAWSTVEVYATRFIAGFQRRETAYP